MHGFYTGVFNPTTHVVGLMFTNNGDGTMDVRTRVIRQEYSTPDAGVILSNSLLVDSVSQNVAHGMSAVELQSLHPALGYYNNSSETTSSGVAYDWESPYTSYFVVPEPSAILLCSMAFPVLLIRRRKS